MLTENDLRLARENVEAWAHTKITSPVRLASGDGFSVTETADGYEICASEIPLLSRALLEILKKQEGLKDTVTVTPPSFDACGCMFDCSRGPVLTVEAAKELIRFLSACGMNLLLLYTEDVYEIPEQPYFGYMRGRYSIAELRELDAYGRLYGVELVPCIQALSHLASFLSYNGGDFRDTARTLLCGEEKTYEFLEQAIRACRDSFSSKKIHIGMDEAFDLGRGKLLARDGAIDKYETLCRHLDRVRSICEKYGFHPMMWSDMFIQTVTPSGLYYDTEGAFTEEAIQKLPDVDMVYWDYYFHKDPEFYDKMILRYKTMKKPVWFAGGASNWYGYLPWWEYADTMTRTGLTACIRHGVRDVFDTLWTNNEYGPDLPFDYPYLAAFAEYRFSGENTDKNDIDRTLRLLCGYGVREAELMGSLDMIADEDRSEFDMFYSQDLVFSDPLYELGLKQAHLEKIRPYYAEKLKELDAIRVREDACELVDVARMAYVLASDKAELRLSLRQAYKAGDKKTLTYLAEQLLPKLVREYDRMDTVLRVRWHACFKPFGYESQVYHYGGMIRRLEETEQVLKDYLAGKQPNIPELDEEWLPTENRTAFKAVTTAGV